LSAALVLAAHGTASRAGLATTEAITRAVAAARPDLTVRLAYLDVARPRLADLLAGGLAGCRGGVVVVPLLLSTGYHIRHDIPTVVGRFGRVAPPLGPDPLLAAALAERLGEASQQAEAGRREGPVVLAAAGSREPETASQVTRMARLLEQRLGRPVTPAYVHSGVSGVPDLRTAVRSVGQRTAIATYLLAEGYFARQVAAAGSELGVPVSAPVGVHPALVTLVLRRYAEIAGRSQLVTAQ
jgi:sirohydrochlorin ferrochelatase